MSIEFVFDDMSYESKTESEDDITAWLKKHQGRIGSIISGKVKDDPDDEIVDVVNLSTDKVLTSVKYNNNDLSEAVKVASVAQQNWISLPAQKRTNLFVNLSNNIMKKCNFFAKLESLSTGHLFRFVQNTACTEVPNTFQYFAKSPGMLSNAEKYGSPLGIVLVSVPSNSSLLSVIKKICPAVASGNSVILYLDGSQDPKTVNLGLFYLVEIFVETGIPVGLLNVVYGSKEIWKNPDVCRSVGGISYVGTLEGGRELRQCTAGSGGFLALFLEYRYVVMVFESGDIDSAVDSTIQIMKCSFDQKCSTRILVQESICKRFLQLLQSSLSNVRVGHSLDPSVDIGHKIKGVFEDSTKRILQINPDGTSQISSPQLDILTFRTTKEATGLVNDTVHDVRASIWTENITLAMEVVKNLSASTIWLNCANEYDPSVETHNKKLSGGGREGGLQCLYQYLQPFWHSTSRYDSEHMPKLPNNPVDEESVKKAVATVQKSQIGWYNLGFSGRGNVLNSVLNGLICKQDVRGDILSLPDIDQLIQQLYFWVTDCDKHSGQVREMCSKSQVLTIYEPKGVIAIILSDNCPLLRITPLIFCAIAMGNAVVIFTKTLSSALTHLVQCFTSGGLPSGLIQIVPDISDLTLSSLFNHHVQAAWHIGSQSIAATLELSSGLKLLQDTWVSFNDNMEWNNINFYDNELLYYLSTSSKVVWLPAGVTFSN